VQSSGWPAYDPASPPGGSLVDAWGLGPAEVVCAVGGGGKTALLERLAREYEQEGRRVVLTTTTRVLAPAAEGRPLVTAPSLEGLLRLLADAPMRSPVVGSGLGEGGKVLPVAPEWVPALRDLGWVAAVLVEADGAARRPLKAPAPWEPVLPAAASLVVAMAGLEAQDLTLDPRHVHRPERLALLLGVAPGSRISPPAVLRALVEGYGPALPPAARLVVYLNKADKRRPEPALVQAAAAGATEVWSGSVRRGEHSCLRPRDRRPAALVLAAGLSRRMGTSKLLMPLGDTSIVGRALGAATRFGTAGTDPAEAGSKDAGPAEVVVVTGPGDEGIRRLLEKEVPAGGYRVVVNPRPEEGQASSLRAGVSALSEPRDLLVILADQPFVGAETLARVVSAARAGPRAAAAGLVQEEDGPLRPPVLLHRSLLPLLLELKGDRGARALLARFRGCSTGVPARGPELLDIDTPEDLERARRTVGGGET
jgi:molybdenum cofactor cytidylyltransferase